MPSTDRQPSRGQALKMRPLDRTTMCLLARALARRWSKQNCRVNQTRQIICRRSPTQLRPIQSCSRKKMSRRAISHSRPLHCRKMPRIRRKPQSKPSWPTTSGCRMSTVRQPPIRTRCRRSACHRRLIPKAQTHLMLRKHKMFSLKHKSQLEKRTAPKRSDRRRAPLGP